MRWNDPSLKNDILMDATGKVVGQVRARRVMTLKERKWATEFCLGLIQMREKRQMAAKAGVAKQESSTKEPSYSDRTNMVFLAGIIDKIDVREKYAWLLMDVGNSDKRVAIPLKAFQKDILAKLKSLQTEDWLQVIASLSQSKNQQTDKYELQAVITSIKKVIPTQRRLASDDAEIPF